jgi:hypothetical protein
VIDAKQAVKIARQYFQELFADQPLVNIQLEEVERTDEGKFWRVTIGFDRQGPGDLRTILGQVPRYYKVVTIDAITGEAESVKIRSDA